MIKTLFSRRVMSSMLRGEVLGCRPLIELMQLSPPGNAYDEAYGVNRYRSSYSHSHEALLHDTARQVGVVLTRGL